MFGLAMPFLVQMPLMADPIPAEEMEKLVVNFVNKNG